MFDPVRVHVIIFILGLFRLSFLPSVLGGAAPFGGDTIVGVFGRGFWFLAGLARVFLVASFLVFVG